MSSKDIDIIKPFEDLDILSLDRKSTTPTSISYPALRISNDKVTSDDDSALLSPNIRKVAGDVRRRKDPVPKAEPPPINRRPKITAAEVAVRETPAQKVDRSTTSTDNGRRHVIWARTSTDSESDDPDRKVPRNKSILYEGPSEHSDSGAVLSRTEEEMRLLRQIQAEWPQIQARRNETRREGISRRRHLIRFHKEKNRPASTSTSARWVEPSGPDITISPRQSDRSTWLLDMRSFVNRLDQQRKNYLNEALYDLQDTLDEVQLTGDLSVFSDRFKRETMERVEVEFLQRCSHFDRDWASSCQTPPGSLQRHVLAGLDWVW